MSINYLFLFISLNSSYETYTNIQSLTSAIISSKRNDNVSTSILLSTFLTLGYLFNYIDYKQIETMHLDKFKIRFARKKII